jgi:transposase InsO family protein
MRKNNEKWAIFWCDLLKPIIFKEIDGRSVNKFLKELSLKEHRFPDGTYKKISLSTLRRKLNQYSKKGLNGVIRKCRRDKGKIRVVPQEIINKAIELKKDQPMRSDDAINRFLESFYGKKISKATLYRHLKKAGATKLKLGVIKKKVRKRWSREQSNDLWVGDFEKGIYVLTDNGDIVATYLSAFIDCYSRYVIEARYYYRETLDILIDSLLRAWAVHGSSKELYLDNAKIYHANSLKAACYALQIKLLHRAAGDPAPGGLIERWFGTCQSQFEAEVRAGDILTLDELNKALAAYLEVAYHQKIHSETKETPKERYENGLTAIRHVDLNQCIQLFMREEVRSVHEDFSDIRLDNKFYKVDPRLRGDKVLVRFDPFSRMDKVLIYSLKNESYLGEGILHHREKGSETPIFSPGKPKNNYLDLLKQEHKKQLDSEAKGIDYRKLVSTREWPFTAFIAKLSKLMGRKGGVSNFTTKEYEMLKKIYNKRFDLNENMLTEAFLRACSKTVPNIVYEIQIFKNRKENE